MDENNTRAKLVLNTLIVFSCVVILSIGIYAEFLTQCYKEMVLTLLLCIALIVITTITFKHNKNSQYTKELISLMLITSCVFIFIISIFFREISAKQYESIQKMPRTIILQHISKEKITLFEYATIKLSIKTLQNDKDKLQQEKLTQEKLTQEQQEFNNAKNKAFDYIYKNKQ